MNIAIIGAGLSGLLAAKQLQDQGHQVVIVQSDVFANENVLRHLVLGALHEQSAFSQRLESVQGAPWDDPLHKRCAAKLCLNF